LSRIREVFADLEGEGALVAYVMGGDPNLSLSRRVVEAVIAGGADIVELGIPFSDPLADGRSIQQAAVRALSARTRPADVLEIAKEVKSRHDVPVVVMTYYNILYSPGLERFLHRARRAGVDGIIVPDLPFDELADYSRDANEVGIDTILLAAPTTTAERMRSLAEHSSGFLYLVSLLGVTGVRSEVNASTLDLIRYAKTYTRDKIPLAVGFGISTPAQVRTVISSGADAAIVGSGIVNKVAQYEGREQGMLDDVEDYVRSLKTGAKKTQ